MLVSGIYMMTPIGSCGVGIVRPLYLCGFAEVRHNCGNNIRFAAAVAAPAVTRVLRGRWTMATHYELHLYPALFFMPGRGPRGRFGARCTRPNRKGPGADPAASPRDPTCC